jgi:hypothetical protein
MVLARPSASLAIIISWSLLVGDILRIEADPDRVVVTFDRNQFGVAVSQRA